MIKTFDFFKMAEIYRRTGILPDDIQVNDGFRQEGRLIGVAVYNDESKIPKDEEMQDIIVDFKLAYGRTKSFVMKKIKQIKKEQEENESHRTT